MYEKFKELILSLDENMNYSDENTIKIIDEYVNLFLEQNIASYLYKTSKELKSDCSAFGNYALKNFKTMQELENYNWLQHYQDSFFKVEPEVVVDSGFLLTGI